VLQCIEDGMVCFYGYCVVCLVVGCDGVFLFGIELGEVMDVLFV